MKHILRKFKEFIRVHLLFRLINSRVFNFYLSSRPTFDPELQKTSKLLELEQLWLKGVRRNNSGDTVRLYALVLNARRVFTRISGSIAEVGVYKGNTSKVLRELAPDRNLFLFDTFSGFVEREIKSSKIDNIEGHFKDTSLEHVKKFIGDGPNIFYGVGFFPETAKIIPKTEKFAFVSLDCDLYEPIMAGLQYFSEKMNKGGIIVVHDYSNPQWPGTKKAVDEFLTNRELPVVLLSDKYGSLMINF